MRCFVTVIFVRSFWGLIKQVTCVVVVFQNPPIPVHREFVTEPGMMPPPVYPEHHLPTYSSVHQPIVTHHSRQSQRSYGRGYDVCDSPAYNSHIWWHWGRMSLPQTRALPQSDTDSIINATFHHLFGLEWRGSAVVEQQTCIVLFTEHCCKMLTPSSRAVWFATSQRTDW